MIYKHRANEVEAFQWGVEQEPDWFKEFCEEAKPERQFAANSLFLPTEWAVKHIQVGCYVFIDPDGYIDAESEEVFNRNYEVAKHDRKRASKSKSSRQGGSRSKPAETADTDDTTSDT